MLRTHTNTHTHKHTQTHTQTHSHTHTHKHTLFWEARHRGATGADKSKVRRNAQCLSAQFAGRSGDESARRSVGLSRSRLASEMQANQQESGLKPEGASRCIRQAPGAEGPLC